MESARDFIKRFSRNSIKLLFGKRSTNPLRCCRMIWMNGCRNTMNYVRTAENIVMEKRLCRHSWIPCLLQKRKCCSIVTTFQTKRKYDRSSDDVVTSTHHRTNQLWRGIIVWRRHRSQFVYLEKWGEYRQLPRWQKNHHPGTFDQWRNGKSVFP